MIRHEEDANQSPGTVYTLYVEYLGGLVPILKGKRTSKIRPEFVIFDPQGTEGKAMKREERKPVSNFLFGLIRDLLHNFFY
jgi:hypothetical protein